MLLPQFDGVLTLNTMLVCALSIGLCHYTVTYIFIGQLVSCMRYHQLRHGFLSTYKTTIFVKRVDDHCFHLSLPIDQYATNPSLRECFAGFLVLAAADSKYVESHDIQEIRVSFFHFWILPPWPLMGKSSYVLLQRLDFKNRLAPLHTDSKPESHVDNKTK